MKKQIVTATLVPGAMVFGMKNVHPLDANPSSTTLNITLAGVSIIQPGG